MWEYFIKMFKIYDVLLIDFIPTLPNAVVNLDMRQNLWILFH